MCTMIPLERYIEHFFVPHNVHNTPLNVFLPSVRGGGVGEVWGRGPAQCAQYSALPPSLPPSLSISHSLSFSLSAFTTSSRAHLKSRGTQLLNDGILSTQRPRRFQKCPLEIERSPANRQWNTEYRRAQAEHRETTESPQEARKRSSKKGPAQWARTMARTMAAQWPAQWTAQRSPHNGRIVRTKVFFL